jgi:DNA (cytosine-5)-methyltransferase 1
MSVNPKYNFIDLFAGCGGLSLGLEQAGFTPVLVNEIVPQFCETYRRNRNLTSDDCFV